MSQSHQQPIRRRIKGVVTVASIFSLVAGAVALFFVSELHLIGNGLGANSMMLDRGSLIIHRYEEMNRTVRGVRQVNVQVSRFPLLEFRVDEFRDAAGLVVRERQSWQVSLSGMLLVLAVLLILRPVWIGVRVFFRQVVGRCTHCGYPLRDSVTCSDCGTLDLNRVGLMFTKRAERAAYLKKLRDVH